MTASDIFEAQRAISSSFERHFDSIKKNKTNSEKPKLSIRILKVLIYIVGFLGPILILRSFLISGSNQNISTLWIVFLLFSPFWIA